MKTFITIAFILAAFAAKSQAYINPEVGYSTKQTFAASLHVGYEFKNIVSEAGTIYNFNRRDPAYFGAKSGYEIVIGRYSVTPLAGVYYRLQSTDNKSLNGFVYGGGIRLQLPNMVTLQCTYVDRTLFFGIGFRG